MFEKDIEKTREKRELHMSNREWHKAIPYALSICTVSPNDAIAMATCHVQVGKRSRGISTIGCARKIWPEDHFLTLWLVAMYVDEFKIDGWPAIRLAYETLASIPPEVYDLAQQPGTREGQYCLSFYKLEARVLCIAEDFESALRSIRTALFVSEVIKANPDSINEALTVQADILIGMEKFDEALCVLKSVLDFNPLDQESATQFLSILKYKKNYVQMEEFASQMINFFPHQYAQLQVIVFFSQIRLKKYAEAEQTYLEVVARLGRSDPAALKIGTQLTIAKKHLERTKTGLEKLLTDY